MTNASFQPGDLIPLLDASVIEVATALVAPIADDRIIDNVGYYPPIARPGVLVKHKIAVNLKRGTTLEGGGEIFSGATDAPQGGTGWFEADGSRTVIDKQRVGAAVPPPSVGAAQYHRLIGYNFSVENGQDVIHSWFTPVTLNMAHQGIGNFYDAVAGKRYLVSGCPEGNTGACPSGKGLIKYEFKGVNTTQADGVEIQLLGAPGSAHWGSKLDGTGIVSNDGLKYLMFCRHGQNDSGSDERDLVFVWDRAEVDAQRLLGLDCTSVKPIAHCVLERPPEVDAAAWQDYECEGNFIYVYSGSTGPLMRHALSITDMARGSPVCKPIYCDDARSRYVNNELTSGTGLRLDGAPLGLPSSMESEMCFKFLGEDALYVGIDENWKRPGDIVSFAKSPEFNWAVGSSGIRETPGNNRAFRKTTLSATVGEWNPDTTNYVGQGTTTRIRLNLVKIMPATGATDEYPLDQMFTTVKTDASLHLADNLFHIIKNPDNAFRFGSQAQMGDRYIEEARLFEGALTVNDTSPRGSGSAKPGGWNVVHRTSGLGAVTAYLEQTLDGMSVRFYPPTDSANPNRLSFNGLLTYAPATGIDFTETQLTFLATVAFVTPGDSTFVYANQSGQYQRIGKRIHWNLRLRYTPTFATASGDLRIITGLPATADSTVAYASASIAHIQGLAAPAGRTQLGALISRASSDIKISASALDGVTAPVFCGAAEHATGRPVSLFLSGSYAVA